MTDNGTIPLSNDRNWFFVIHNGPTALYNTYLSMIDALEQRSVKIIALLSVVSGLFPAMTLPFKALHQCPLQISLRRSSTIFAFLCRSFAQSKQCKNVLLTLLIVEACVLVLAALAYLIHLLHRVKSSCSI
jgi:hypothetical protein